MGAQHCGGVAQLGERYNRTVEVRGSNPLTSTTENGAGHLARSILFAHCWSVFLPFQCRVLRWYIPLGAVWGEHMSPCNPVEDLFGPNLF